MCGIAGIVAKDASRYHDTLDRMMARLRHRGPDGTGFYCFGTCALGHSRLSIVDGERGPQPMLSDDNTIGLTFDGEIYGYRSIRDSLDYPYQTASGTEVIIALYRRFGKRLLEHLRGMFAFAIWDARNEVLFCARDRFGEKPLYYALGTNGEFIFASEIKGILASGLVDSDLNPDALAHYVQNLHVHPSHSIYRRIHSLPPAHALTYHDGRVEVFRYWDLPAVKETLSIEDAVAEFRSLFERAVEKQLAAHVPVGAFLSGGLDSTTVVSIASRLSRDLTTFSFGFENGMNELPYAREAAEMYGTRHVELQEDSVVRLDDLLFEMQGVYDEPFADSSNIPTYLLAKLAREHTKVVLGGDGGDELLGGYCHEYRFLFDSQQEMQRQLDRSWLGRELFFLSHRISKRLHFPISRHRHEHARGVRLSKNLTSFAEMHRKKTEHFAPKQLRELGLRPWTPPGAGNESNSMDDGFRIDLVDYMPGDELVKTDRACMAHGLELRSPFLDVDFAEFCISLPYGMKITTSTDKRILRESFSHRWPETIRTRGKQGFGPPVRRWLRRPELVALKREFLANPQKRLYSILDYRAAEKYLEEDTDKTWMLLVLSLWLEMHSSVAIMP